MKNFSFILVLIGEALFRIMREENKKTENLVECVLFFDIVIFYTHIPWKIFLDF